MRPRQYQEEIFRQAQAGNRIAALDTGSGKTYIGLMLIKWIASQPKNKDKMIVFLVPRVALVEQQGNFIAANSPLRVTQKHGQNALDMADREGWASVFATSDVLVMTAQIYLDLLTHSHWSIARTSLIIFDECHHVQKNDPYRQIMDEYRHCAPALRPRVLGLTASPIWDARNPGKALAALEAKLDAQVVGVRRHAGELDAHTARPREVIKTYGALGPEEVDKGSFPGLGRCMEVFGSLDWEGVDVMWRKIIGRYDVTLTSLGPYCASLYLYQELSDIVSRLRPQAEAALERAAEDSAGPSTTGKISLEHAHSLLAIEDILTDYEPYFSDLASSEVLLDDWFSPKVHALVDVLLEQDLASSRGIVFVDQRQVALCLALVLPRLSRLQGLVRCASFIGQNPGIDGPKAIGSQRDVAGQFRSGEVNLLIATSVAEEGHDFQACDLVVRFDPLQHLVGYLQSRGRARNKFSMFVVMLPEGDESSKAKYDFFRKCEPRLREVYNTRSAEDATNVDADDEVEELSPEMLAERERFVVPSTGAILTYDNAIGLLGHLCSLIPHDPFSPPPAPVYTGDFISTVQLPRSIPLPPSEVVFQGATKTTKKEAKRSAAFRAVRHLHAKDVFDDYLLPMGSRKKARVDADGRIIDISDIPVMLDVLVVDPWTIGRRLWLHPIIVDGRCVAGLVTGSVLSDEGLSWKGYDIKLGEPRETCFDEDERDLLGEYTRLCVWYRITARPLPSQHMSLFIVPLTPDIRPDIAAVRRLLRQPYGSSDWSAVDVDDVVAVMNENEHARLRRLCGVRDDLTVMSPLPPGSREDARLRSRIDCMKPTYRDYFVDRWTRKKWEARVPCDGPLIQTTLMPRSSSRSYHISNTESMRALEVPDGALLPQGHTKWVHLSEDMLAALNVLPPLLRHATDVHRANKARLALGLPYIERDLLIQALTLPCAAMPFNNQRLETLGDAVLELSTTVHLFNKYPHRHEGQLTPLRQICISNKCLLTRAREVQLERFLTSETHSLSVWDYTEDAKVPARCARRLFPRRSLQDCMEAILGASYLTGGIDSALHAGTSLGLAFGGSVPWPRRYPRRSRVPVPDLFSELQAKLGYTFRDGVLLCEALTHSSFASLDSYGSYERLEFLGDAVINLAVVDYLYRKFPDANSDQLSLPRARAVCNQALSALSVKHLELHKSVLVNNVELSMAISKHIPILEAAPYPEILTKGWKLDPPKVLSDVFESVVGAVFVDTGYDYEKTAAVVEQAMEGLLVHLSPAMPRDPVSELIIWVAKSTCREQIEFRRTPPKKKRYPDGIAIYLHGTLLAGPITTMNHLVSRKLASERALSDLRDPQSPRAFGTVCCCSRRMDVDKRPAICRTEDVDSIMDEAD
ncbi:hypothetical protein K525DRAFT_196949 [Schizophyllum commune Loenen D]|nr:hypothetical protein K525DRAFT_196949 [Schizophyllum commune Loenen D]